MRSESLVIVCLVIALSACGQKVAGPGEFVTTHLAQVDGVVRNGQWAPQESVTVTGRSLRLDAPYVFGVGVTDPNGAFSFKIGKIDGTDRPAPDTLSVMLRLQAHGSKYPRGPTGQELADSVPVLVRFAGRGKPAAVTRIDLIFRFPSGS